MLFVSSWFNLFFLRRPNDPHRRHPHPADQDRRARRRGAHGLGCVEQTLSTLDPWGNPYKYLSPGQSVIQTSGQSSGLRTEYDIISLGTDGEVGGEGINADITNWNLDKE